MNKRQKPRSRRIPAEQVFAAFQQIGFDCAVDSFGIVRDVSQSGLSLVTPQAPAVPSRVAARISVGEETFEMRLTARRLEELGGGRYLVGMAFEGPQRERLPFLRAYLSSVDSGAPS